MNKACIILFSLALIISVAAVTLSCASHNKPIETEADFTGFITDVQPDRNKDVIGRISVESHADKIVTKYVVTVKDDTLLFQQDGGNFHNTTFNTLKNKQWVKIWFSGPVMESFPMQATAQQAIVVDYATLIK
jgi:hypothetical protein